jgi:putative methylase
MGIRSKKELAVILSQLQGIEHPVMALEQYETPSEIAADWIWQAALLGDVAGKTILDAGCGSGILGIGVLLLGAKKVYFVEKSEQLIAQCQENIRTIEEAYEIGEPIMLHQDIAVFDERVDVVFQNPPFGTKIRHSDRIFLEKAFALADVVYSMHKWSTKAFVEAMARDAAFRIDRLWRYEFPLKRTLPYHRKLTVVIDVGLWRLVKEHHQ